MATNKKQTAVDYLFEKLFYNYESLHHGKIELHTFFELNIKNRDEAKQMECEQMKDMFLIGDEDGYKRCYYNGNHKDINFYKMYEETYGK